MQRIKFFSTSLLVSSAIIFLCTTGFTHHGKVTRKATPVTITAVYNFSTFPDVWGTFTISGALNISGKSEMVIGPNSNGVRAHCDVTLFTPQGNILIDQECQFSSDPAKGRWEIVGGTGIYSTLKGNGSLTMPPNTEAMTGFIY